jgi:hypothetical protein
MEVLTKSKQDNKQFAAIATALSACGERVLPGAVRPAFLAGDPSHLSHAGMREPAAM